MPNYWDEELFSMRMATQTAFDAVDGSPTWVNLLATLPSITLNRETEDLNLSVSSDFVTPAKAVGRKSGTISFSIPLRSQLDTYDPSSGSPVENPEIELLKDIFGASDIGVYDAGEWNVGATAQTWPMLTPAAPKIGSCYLVQDQTSGLVTAHGWIQDISGSDAVLFEDSDGIPASGDHQVQCITLYPDASTPGWRTFRLVGSSADHCVDYIGCVPESAKILFEAGQTPKLEVSYQFTDWRYVDTAGGLVTATDYVRLAPAMGVNGARVWLDGRALSADTGANTVGTCGLSSLAVDITIPVRPLPCHSNAQGLADLIVARRRATVTFAIPHTTDYTNAAQDESDFGLSLANGVKKSLSISLGRGKAPGNFFAMLMAQGVVTDQPSYGPVDGIMSWTVTMAADEWSGDGTGDASPIANTALRAAFG